MSEGEVTGIPLEAIVDKKQTVRLTARPSNRGGTSITGQVRTPRDGHAQVEGPVSFCPCKQTFVYVICLFVSRPTRFD